MATPSVAFFLLRHLTTNLTCLECSGNPRIQTLTPFASTLLELAATQQGCGIKDEAFSSVRNGLKLVCVDVSTNNGITTVAPFHGSLRHLIAQGDALFPNNESSDLSDAGLISATKLVTLDCSHNPNITSIAPFADCLERLIACGTGCGMQGEEIATAPLCLQKVDVMRNPKVTPEKHLTDFYIVDGDVYYVRRQKPACAACCGDELL